LALSTDFVPLNKFSSLRLIALLLFAPIILKYIIHLLIAPWYSLVESSRSKKRPKNYTPSVSVIIPAWNEEVGILTTIKSTLNTRYPNLEIIIVNDGSTDKTHQILTKFVKEYKNKRHDQAIKYKRISNGGKARALNTALSMARSEIIITIDADSTMEHGTIKNMVKHFTDPRVAAVAGNVAIGNRKKSIGLIQQLEYMYGFYFKRADSLLNAVYIVGGAAAAYRKKIVADMGGFDENSITEDIELSTRLQDHGHHIRYSTDAIVHTEGPLDLKGLCNQRLRWKFGRLLTFYKYRHLFFSLDRKHNPYLGFLILPIALFAEILLFFEGVLLALFYLYTFYTNDFTPLVFVILLLTLVICLQIISDPNASYHKNLFLIAPGGWLLFYIVDIVEYQALIRSLWNLLRKKRPSWQNWIRKGVFEGKEMF